MPSTANYNWSLPTPGGSSGTWGTTLNAAFDAADASLKGVSDAKLSLTGGTVTGELEAARFLPSGSTIPTRGMYLPAANTLGFATASTLALKIDPNGQITTPLQPMFLAYLSSSTAGVTGDSTAHTVIFDTEIFDRNADYNNATGTFTAPVTGIYRLTARVCFATLGAAHTTGIIAIVTGNRTHETRYGNVGAMRDANNDLTLSIDVLADMDAADTATVVVRADNGALSVVVRGSSTAITTFQGELVG